jgi:protein-S-isoprenylcysteine O-methyltransferase Ste14
MRKIRKKSGLRLLPVTAGIFGMAILISVVFMIAAYPELAKKISVSTYWIFFSIGILFLMLILVFFLDTFLSLLGNWKQH